MKKFLSVFLAFLLVCSLALPSAAAELYDKDHYSLADLIAIDRDLIERSRENVVKNYETLGYTREEAENIALGMMLYTQLTLFQECDRALVFNVADTLTRRQEMPKSIHQCVYEGIRFTDDVMVKAIAKNSMPERTVDIVKPGKAVKKTLAEHGGKPAESSSGLQVVPGQMDKVESFFTDPDSYLKTHSVTSFEPRIALSIRSGDNMIVVFSVIYNGKEPRTVNGLSEIEITDSRDSSICYAGGSAADADSGDFLVPIHFNPGEMAVMVVEFWPGTWYDLNWSDMNTLTPGTTTDWNSHYHIQWKVTNHV